MFLELKYHRWKVTPLTVDRDPPLFLSLPVSSAISLHVVLVYPPPPPPSHHGSSSSHSDLPGQPLAQRFVSTCYFLFERALADSNMFCFNYVVSGCVLGTMGALGSPKVLDSPKLDLQVIGSHLNQSGSLEEQHSCLCGGRAAQTPESDQCQACVDSLCKQASALSSSSTNEV